MKILVDGDSCPVKDIIEEIGSKYNIEIIIFVSVNHVINADIQAKLVTVDSYNQSVDIELINRAKDDDIVITNDYGLASLAIQKKCYSLSPNGYIFNKENINKFLVNRYINMEARKKGIRMKGPHKRKKKDDKRFKQNLIQIIKEHIDNN